MPPLVLVRKPGLYRDRIVSQCNSSLFVQLAQWLKSWDKRQFGSLMNKETQHRLGETRKGAHGEGSNVPPLLDGRRSWTVVCTKFAECICHG